MSVAGAYGVSGLPWSYERSPQKPDRQGRTPLEVTEGDSSSAPSCAGDEELYFASLDIPVP
jgi:hypothetical protein